VLCPADTSVANPAALQCVEAQVAVRQPIRIDWFVFQTGLLGLAALLSGAFLILLAGIVAYLMTDSSPELTERQRRFVLAATPFVAVAVGAVALWIARSFLEFRTRRVMAICAGVLAVTAIAGALGTAVGVLLLPAIFPFVVGWAFRRRWWPRP
jgi:hypothetical protein